VLLVAGQVHLDGQLQELAVDAHPTEAPGGQVGQELLVGTLATADHRCDDLEPGALGQVEDPVDDLLRRLAHQPFAGLRAVRHADPGEQKTQIVVDLGDGADGRAGVAPRAFLVDRDGRAEPLDLIDVRFFHQTQELAGIGGERFDITALPFGVDCVEGQAAFAAAAEPGDDDQLVARDLQVNIFEVVFSRTPYYQFIQRHCVFSAKHFLGCQHRTKVLSVYPNWREPTNMLPHKNFCTAIWKPKNARQEQSCVMVYLR